MKRFSPATQRNREPILEVLRLRLPAHGLVLELASGTGEHAAYFARALPQLEWQPTDVEAAALESIEAWRQEAALPNLRAPLPLDATQVPWPIERAAAMFCANMIHISPWPATEALFAGAGRVLPAGAALFTYGPYRFAGDLAPSNLAFDESLRARDASWGVRDVEDLKRLALEHELALEETIAMPANNHVLVFRRTSTSPQGF
jgi:SAM-dependent methyltransferase